MRSALVICWWLLAASTLAEPLAMRSAEPATAAITAAEPIRADQIEVTDGDTIERGRVPSKLRGLALNRKQQASRKR